MPSNIVGLPPAPAEDFNEFAEEVRVRLQEMDRKLDSLCVHAHASFDATNGDKELLPHLPEAACLQPAWIVKGHHSGHEHGHAPHMERKPGPLTAEGRSRTGILEERKTGILAGTEERKPGHLAAEGRSRTGILEERKTGILVGTEDSYHPRQTTPIDCPHAAELRTLHSKSHSFVASQHLGAVRDPDSPRLHGMSLASFGQRNSTPAERKQRTGKGNATMTSRSRHRPVVLSHIWMFLEDAESSQGAYWFSVLFPIFTTTTVAVSLLQTIKPPILDPGVAAVLEVSFEVLFALEFFTRFVSCPNYWAFFRNGYNMIDLACVAPISLRASVGFRLDAEEETAAKNVLLCIVPLLRLLKTLRRFQEIQLLWAAFVGAWEALPVLLYTAFTMNLGFSALIYMVEPRTNIPTFGKAMWLTLVTMMTIGYGDMTPKSDAGTVVVSFLIVCSCLYMAMPLGIVGQIFFQIWEQRDRILVMKRTRAALTQWGYQAHDIPMLFDLFDTDGDGYLTLCEFQQMIDFLDLGMSRSRVRRLFDTFDVDGGGTVSDAEFVRGLFPSYYHDLFVPGGGFSPLCDGQAPGSMCSGPAEFGGASIASEQFTISGLARSPTHALLTAKSTSTVIADGEPGDSRAGRRGSMVVVRGRRGSALVSRRFDAPPPNNLVMSHAANKRHKASLAGSEAEDGSSPRPTLTQVDSLSPFVHIPSGRRGSEDSSHKHDGIPMPMIPSADKSEDFYSM